jgi:hypothetical protein
VRVRWLGQRATARRIESGGQAPRLTMVRATHGCDARPKAVSGPALRAGAGLPWPFARRGSCLGLKSDAIDFLSTEHNVSFMSRRGEGLRHKSAFWRDGSQPRHSPGHLPGLSICAARRREAAAPALIRHPTCISSATSSLWRCVSVLANTDFN